MQIKAHIHPCRRRSIRIGNLVPSNDGVLHAAEIPNRVRNLEVIDLGDSTTDNARGCTNNSAPSSVTRANETEHSEGRWDVEPCQSAWKSKPSDIKLENTHMHHFENIAMLLQEILRLSESTIKRDAIRSTPTRDHTPNSVPRELTKDDADLGAAPSP